MDWVIEPTTGCEPPPEPVFKAGCYDIKTSGVHSGDQSKQPAGWGLSAWQKHGGSRNHASSWAAVHSGDHWPMPWKIEKSSRTPGMWTIKTTAKHAGASASQPAGWGLSSWMEHGAKRNGASARVAVHSGDHWLMVRVLVFSINALLTFQHLLSYCWKS